jgi:hypothetical protein
MGQLTGRAYITVSGQRLASKDGAKLNTGAVERTGVVLDTGVGGYTEKDTVPFVECTLHHDADTDLSFFADLVDANVMFDTDTGKSFVLSDAWRAGTIEMTNGEVSLKFEGMSCEEV